LRGIRPVHVEPARERLAGADADIFIGAIAVAHDAVLFTGNTRRFARFPGLWLEDWIR
jgi:predicted nucleic acid-binding protein